MCLFIYFSTRNGRIGSRFRKEYVWRKSNYIPDQIEILSKSLSNLNPNSWVEMDGAIVEFSIWTEMGNVKFSWFSFTSALDLIRQKWCTPHFMPQFCYIREFVESKLASLKVEEDFCKIPTIYSLSLQNAYG